MVAMKKILLVEDEIEIQILLGHILRAEGYQTDETGTTKSALHIIERRPFDLVIADANLPDGGRMAVGDKAREKGVKVLINGYAFRIPKEELSRFARCPEGR